MFNVMASFAMKIALLHPTFWPQPGGVEHVMRDQANMLVRAGHDVTVITGLGRATGEDYKVNLLAELAPDDKLNTAVRATLERGMVDKDFNKYRDRLIKVLGKALGPMDLTIVHNAFTMHGNLPLTAALHELAPKHRLIAWTHDVAAAESDQVVPNPTKAPWNLMRTSAANVLYIAVSEMRRGDLAHTLQPPVEAEVIPNPVDVARLFGLTPEIRASLASLSLAERDLILLLPARVQMRKNIEFALQVVQRLCEMNFNPLLIITGDKEGQSEGGARYADYIRQSLPELIIGNVVFVSEFFKVQDDTLRDLYLLADCLLFPSKREGFGLPIVEAALHRLPAWCSKMPAWWTIEGDGCFVLDTLDDIPQAIDWLQEQPTFRAHRRCRKLFDPAVVYQEYYEPILQIIPPAR
jgi:glycosyltransferase involved in cell wall biosynthesis